MFQKQLEGCVVLSVSSSSAEVPWGWCINCTSSGCSYGFDRAHQWCLSLLSLKMLSVLLPPWRRFPKRSVWSPEGKLYLCVCMLRYLQGRACSYSGMAGQCECSLQRLSFSGLLQTFPSLVMLALQWRPAITWAIFGIKSLCTHVPWKSCSGPLCVLREALSAKNPCRFLQIKVRQLPSQVLMLEGTFLLLPLSSWATWQKGRHLISSGFSGICVCIVFSQHWCSFAGGRVNSCPQSTGRLEMTEQLHCLPA